jgi:PAS domain S-box-containing protein
MIDLQEQQDLDKMYRIAVEHAGIGISITYLDGRIWANKAFSDMLGYTHQEIKSSWQELTYTEDIALSQSMIDGLVADEYPVATWEKRFLHKSGSIIWASLTSVLIRDTAGKPHHLITSITDITPKKQNQEELIRINRLYSMISQTNQLIVRCKSIEELFPEVCRITVEYGKFRMAWVGLVDETTKMIKPISWYGYNDDYLEKIRISVEDIPEGRGPTGTCIRTSLSVHANDIINDPRMEVWRKDALIRGYNSSIALPIIVRNKAVGAFTLYSPESFFFNEAEINLLESITKDIAYAMEMIKAEEKRKRNEQALLESTDQLSVAIKELESFSYSVSHDLRTPLRGIEGWSCVLLEDYADSLDQQGKQYLEWIRSDTKRMDHTIDALLQLARMNRTEIQESEVDLSNLVSVSYQRELNNDHYKDRLIDFKIEPDLMVNGDSNLLDIVITNLVHNALKFTNSQANTQIEFGAIKKSGKRIFYLTDNGVGFDMAYADHLFQPFQRLHKDSEYPGTGIGLAIVQRIIKRHGGEVWARSTIGEGATFYFSLCEKKNKE